MRVPLKWLKQYVPVEATAEEIATRLTMGGLEVEGIETNPADFPLVPVLDVYVTPNRGDCLSMVGVAREVAALTGHPLHIPAPPPSTEGGETAQLTSVTIEDDLLCPRYAARLVRDVTIGPSPQWMQDRLLSAGQRPINNVVDVTNYVMLELGQPLHAFDLDKLAGRRIVIRRVRDGETLTTLDGEARSLLPDMLVIADAEKPVAIAGVMGGAASEVSAATTNLLLESAHFDPLSVRRTSRALGLRTEASYRFERVVDPDGVRRALDRACQLLAEIGQPEAVPGVVDITPRRREPRGIALRVTRATELLGTEITSHVAADSLRALGFEVLTEPHGSTDTLRVHVPAFRPDITLEEDLIEEVGRIYGYENIPETLPVGDTTQGGDSEEGDFLMRVRRRLVGCGLQEVVTHSLTAPFPFAGKQAVERVPVRNTLSTEVSGLRQSLIPTLLDVAQTNAARGQHAMALFEVGRVWFNRGKAVDEDTDPVESLSVAGLLTGPMSAAGWQRDARLPAADFALARGIVDQLCDGLGIAPGTLTTIPARPGDFPYLHPGRAALLSLGRGEHLDVAGAGVLGEIHPQIAAKIGLRERIYVFELGLDPLYWLVSSEGPRYSPLSRFPSVSRDLAPRVPKTCLYARIEEAIRTADAPILAVFRLTDVFMGPPLPEDIKSMTLTFTFRASDRTLTEADVNDALARLRAQLERLCGATFAA